MVTAAVSLAMACTELGGETRELAWLIYDRDGSLSVLPLALGAMEIGTAASGAKTVGELEVAGHSQGPCCLRDRVHLRPEGLYRPPLDVVDLRL